MAINLGFIPIDISVTLAYGGEFLSSLVSPTPWDVGVIIELHFCIGNDSAIDIAVWTASIDGATASWDMSTADVATVTDSAARTARLVYTDGSGDVIVWGTGQVNVV